MEFPGAIREAKKGAAELVVLAFLEDESLHGYELTQRIEERSGGALTFNFASLYATLYKLEERKWIQGRWVEKAGQRRRRYYKITPEGRERSEEHTSELQSRLHLVCRLLLEKKKTEHTSIHYSMTTHSRSSE